ncbi:MAG: hypothetical protein ACLFQB_07565 [Chitinispirillaceae bacterium]
MTSEEYLKAVLENTIHINGGIKAGDMDIVLKAIQAKEELLTSFGQTKIDVSDPVLSQIAQQIRFLDKENRCLLTESRKKCESDMFEVKRRVMELETGKKAAEQYHFPTGRPRGAKFDMKR